MHFHGFIHFVKCNRLGLQKAEDLVYVHSNLHLVSHRGEGYTSGPHIEWDVDAECPSLEMVFMLSCTETHTRRDRNTTNFKKCRIRQVRETSVHAHTHSHIFKKTM